MSRHWYYYTGPDGFEGVLSNYQAAGEFLVCAPGTRLCAIYTPGGEFPAGITANISNYISAAKATTLPQPQLPVGAKYFVYSKTSAV